ncbi:MAG: hypothetical protein GX670_02630 [Bacteroidales bacterium]|nr:hypothetical protein [Bacteroidales bacterium]
MTYMWKELILVGAGGTFGSMLRFLTSSMVSRFTEGEWLFLETYAANIIGCHGVE